MDIEMNINESGNKGNEAKMAYLDLDYYSNRQFSESYSKKNCINPFGTGCSQCRGIYQDSGVQTNSSYTNKNGVRIRTKVKAYQCIGLELLATYKKA